MTINCKGSLIDFDTPKVMGILNVTPDSFYDGGKYKNESDILKQVDKMLYEGATFIDVGAYSSKPNAQKVNQEQELKRILPIIKLLVREFPKIIISVDTFRSTIALDSINAGAAMINDISGGNLDKNMFNTVASLQVPYILMHMEGTPQTMQQNPSYENVTKTIISFLSKKVFELRNLKVNDIIIDVGFGFGKSINHNFQLLRELALFQNLDLPNLVGVSRKSMLYKLLDISPTKSLNATTCANTIALLNGANILRVHDVKEAIQTVKIVKQTHM